VRSGLERIHIAPVAEPLDIGLAISLCSRDGPHTTTMKCSNKQQPLKRVDDHCASLHTSHSGRRSLVGVMDLGSFVRVVAWQANRANEVEGLPMTVVNFTNFQGVLSNVRERQQTSFFNLQQPQPSARRSVA
jgi:hypothetical protein